MTPTGVWAGRTSSLRTPAIAEVNALATELAGNGHDLVDLGQAVFRYPPPQLGLDAVRAALSGERIHHYSSDLGLPELRDALGGYLRSRKKIPYPDMGHVMVTCGANQAFANALFAVTRPGDEVITFGPGYFDHDYTIAMSGCCKVEVALPVIRDRYEFELGAVEKAVTARTRCIVLVSPGNPTGAVATRSFLLGLIELAKDRGLWVISDETYDMLTFPPTVHTSPAAVSDYEQTAVVGSFSKLFAMAGWRIGYLAGSKQLIKEAFKVQDAFVICAPVPGQIAILDGLKGLDGYVSSACMELAARRDALLRALGDWGLAAARIPSGATFLLARVEATDDVSFCKAMVREAGVVAVPGSAFGEHGRGMVRFSFGNQTVLRILEAGRRLEFWKPSV